MGIARCFTFGGRFGRVLHDPAVLPRTEGLTKEKASKLGKLGFWGCKKLGWLGRWVVART